MTGMKIKGSMLKMVGQKTLKDMADMMGGMGRDLPENAMLILNAQLNKIKK